MNQSPELLRRLLRAKDRMDRASHEEWPVARLAEVSAVSPAHFARSFKQAFGLPPHRYLLSRRIERAVALLRDTDLAVTEIAAQTGLDQAGMQPQDRRGQLGRFRSGAFAGVRVPLVGLGRDELGDQGGLAVGGGAERA